MKRASWPLIIFLLLSLLFAVGLMLNPREVPSPLIGQQTPSLDGQQLDTSTSFQPEVLQHQAWLLNVWASWCTGCLTEHPLFKQLAQQPGLVLVGLNYKDEAKAAQDWLNLHGNPYDYVITDPQGRLGLDWGVYAVPETFLIDAQGIVQRKWIGALTQQQIEQELLPAWRSLQTAGSD